MKRPNRRELITHYLNVISKKESYEWIGRVYWVSWNAVRKWFKTHWLDMVKLQWKSMSFDCCQCWSEVVREPNQFSKTGKYFCNNRCKWDYMKEHPHTYEDNLYANKTHLI